MADEIDVDNIDGHDRQRSPAYLPGVPSRKGCEKGPEAREMPIDDKAKRMVASWKFFEGQMYDLLQKQSTMFETFLQESRQSSPKAAVDACSAEPKGASPTDMARRPSHVWNESGGSDSPVQKKKMPRLLKERSMMGYANISLTTSVGRYADLPENHPFMRLLMWWENLEEVVRRNSRLVDIVESKVFHTVCMAAIVIHAVLSTLAQNADMHHALSGTSDPGKYIEYDNIFLVWYSVEVALRIIAHRGYFFWGEDRGWNWFDFVLVLQAFAVSVLSAIDTGNMMILRPLRLLKVVRVLRTLRAVRFLQELRLMLVCMVQSASTMLWCGLLIMYIQYFFSMILVQGMAAYMYTEPQLLDEERRDIRTWFGSVQGSVLALWMAVTGGINWSPMYDIVKIAGEWEASVLLFYTAFFMIAAFNIVTGTFVNKAFNIARPDPEMLVKAKNMQDADYARRLTTLFHHADADGDGCLTQKELVQVIENERHALLEVIGCSNVDGEALFDLLAYDEAGDGYHKVDIKAFVTGLLMLSGPGRSIDVHLTEHRLMNMLDTILRSIRGPGGPRGPMPDWSI